ncbi:FUSC family protein [Burkholderia orbicola]|uniref:FUSC family protein n=1 Tax=Burkholderia orbicola TaxID=2978683 RepID=UPI003AF7B2E3
MSDAIESNRAMVMRFIASELRAFPGRWNVALRCLMSSAIALIISQALQVPFLALSLFIVFFVTQANVVMTRLVAILMFLGVTLAIVVSIVLAQYTFGYPAWRIVLVVALLLGCLFMMRASKLGPVFYMIALVVVNVQGYFDQVSSGELVVRGILWIWVASIYPLTICLLINALFLPIEPLPQLKAEVGRQLMQVDGVLARAMGESSAEASFDRSDLPYGVLAVQKLLRFAWMRDKAFQTGHARHIELTAALSMLREQALCAEEQADMPTSQHLAALRKACSRLNNCIQEEKRFDLIGVDVPSESEMSYHGPYGEMWHTLSALAAESGVSDKAAVRPTEAQFEPDTFSNSVYMRFALKSVLAMMLCYVFYVSVDWPGIHTAMATCLIVAQPSLGASSRKMHLRVIGALIGGGLAIFVAVFVMPILDNVVGMLLIALPVLTFSAYLSAGSERVSYGGMQIMFTFALAVLGDFSASGDLTSVRDRLVGIAVGIGVSYLIHTFLWPESEGNLLARQIGGLLRRIAGLIGGHATGGISEARSAELSQAWAEFNICDEMLSRVVLEPSWQQNDGEHEDVLVRLQALLVSSREILIYAAAMCGVIERYNKQIAETQRQALERARNDIADCLRRYADGLIDSGDVFYVLQDRHELVLAFGGGASLPASPHSLLYERLRHLSERIQHLATSAQTENTI